MGFFDKFFNKGSSNIKWEEIKKTKEVYPPNSISLLMISTNSGKPGTAWIDKGYDKYPYKMFCPYNFIVMIDLTDSIAESNPDLDMGRSKIFLLTS